MLPVIYSLFSICYNLPSMATYHAYFTSGALLLEETEMFFQKLAREQGADSAELLVPPEWMPANSAKARQTTAREVQRRINAVDSLIWTGFTELDAADQKLLLYYACCKAYALLFDFHLQVLLDKWVSSTRTVARIDVENFLIKQSIAHPEIDEWTLSTKTKLSQVTMRILAQANIIDDEASLQKPQASVNTWRRISNTGDQWFLEFMFLNQEEKNRMINQPGE